MSSPYAQTTPIEIDTVFDLSVAGVNVTFIPPGVNISQVVCVVMPAGGQATLRIGPTGAPVSVTPNLIRNFFHGFSAGIYLDWPASALGGKLEMLAPLSQGEV